MEGSLAQGQDAAHAHTCELEVAGSMVKQYTSSPGETGNTPVFMDSLAESRNCAAEGQALRQKWPRVCGGKFNTVSKAVPYHSASVADKQGQDAPQPGSAVDMQVGQAFSHFTSRHSSQLLAESPFTTVSDVGQRTTSYLWVARRRVIGYHGVLEYVKLMHVTLFLLTAIS